MEYHSLLNKLAPLGRMSLTNYMMQSLLGAFIFYGFGLGMATCCGAVSSLLIALVLFIFQILFSRWWLKHHGYGPLEKVWRMATWIYS
ncbi:MAG: DUF418 domain-containing protein [Bacteroides sp.]|nr:DUF418 domain-containing protein [Bacteroides sp.]